MSESIGKFRITKLASAILRAGGIVSFETAMSMLGENKQATWRALEWLVKADMLRKIRIPGGCHVWMSERTLVHTFNPKERPAVNKLSRNKERWVPGPTFDHDQLALRVLFSLAEPWDFLTEHEIRVAGNWMGRVPDGVLRIKHEHFPESDVVMELEIERSRKTGALFRQNGVRGDGGWAKLVDRLYRLSHNCIDGRQMTSLGMTEQMLVVAPESHAKSIFKKVVELHSINEQYEGPGPTNWCYAKLLSDGAVGAPRFCSWDTEQRRMVQAASNQAM